MKKILVLLFILLFPKSVYALNISAKSACVIIPETGEIIFQKNADERLPMASTTKIITAITALENSNPNDIVTVSRNAEGTEGSSIYISAGDKIKMGDLLYGLMLNSGNDAAVAIAEHIGGNVENFAKLMEETAKKAGAKNSSFENPNGLDSEAHYTTAKDLAIISAYAMKNDVFRKIVSEKTKNVTINKGDILYFRNHNKMLSLYEGATGIKTGFTKKSGRCLVSSAKRNGIELIAVTLNAPDDWDDHTKMLDEGFKKCKKKKLYSGNLKTVRIDDTQVIGCVLAENIEVTATEKSVNEARIVIHLPDEIKAPLENGEKIGEADIYLNDKFYRNADILSDRQILKKNIKETFLKVIKKFLEFEL